MTSCKFNITPRMLHLQLFNWFKQFAEGAILMDTALDSIEFTLGSNFDHNEWMDLAYCIMMELDCWHDIKRAFMQKLGIGGSSSELNAPLPDVSTLSGDQESTLGTLYVNFSVPAPSPGSISSLNVLPRTGPLLKDPSAWRLMKDWGQDKFGYAYGPCYVHEEWKELINEVFMQSDPGAENAIPTPLVIERAMELQGIHLTADSAPAPPLGPSTSGASTSSQGATCHHHLSSSGATQKKHHKLNTSIFLDIDAEDKGDDIDEGDDVDDMCEDEEGNGKERSIHYPQQVGPLGKGSFLCNIDILCKRFDHRTQESVAIRSLIDPQIPAGIFLPPLKNIYIVDFYSASARTFAIEYMKKLQELEAMTLLWLPLWLYVEASCPLREGTSIMVFKAQQILPTPNWVQIKKSAYKGDLGYVAESTEGKAVMLVTPHQLPYDSLEESGKRTRFDFELARVADLDLVPILASSGVEIGYSCNGHQFIHELLRLPLPVNTLELVEVLHPDDIRFHAAAGIDPPFVKLMLNLFSAQFWVFSTGDTVEVIAGPFCGERGYVVALHEHTVILVIMQPNKTSETVEVSRFVVQSHLQEHILSLSPADNALQSAFPHSGDEALPGDIVQVHHGPFTGQGGIIEWVSPDSKIWVSKSGKGKNKEDALTGECNPASSQIMVAMDISDLHIEQALNMLTFSKDRGYNVAVGDTVEVARGQWQHSEGIVKTVDLTKASLDICLDALWLMAHFQSFATLFDFLPGIPSPLGQTRTLFQWEDPLAFPLTLFYSNSTVDRIQINVPIMFVCKIKEHFDHGLSQFVGHDVWIVAGDKKGCQAMLHSLGRVLSWVGIFEQLQHSLKSLHSQSFITPVVLHNVTSPPSPGPLDVGPSDVGPSDVGPSDVGPSDVGPSDVCSVTPTDITETQTLDYGEVPWLFKSDFCDFKSFHFGFNISVSFTQVSLVTGHNAGLAMQHLTIPAQYLRPADPTGKNQLCLILKGPQAGRVVSIKKCQQNSKLVMTDDGTTLQFSDICVTFEYNHA
ncbi:hypothetical protein EDC04DRAFT_2605759 [Pisolithus marmoratus]|nr:hypothetical protein EDC04DRAFT_2605759 [Pisolithus marmoratus]